MIPFLKDVAADIYQKHQSDFKNVCFVFPNKRTSLFFKKYLAEIAGKTIWAPDIYTINTFVKKQTKLSVADNLSLIFDLMKIFNRHFTKSGENPYEFDRFYQMGEIILADFNDADNYLVDIDQLFRNVKDLNEIDLIFEKFTEEEKQIIHNFWRSFSPEKLTKEKESFIRLWTILPDVYHEFKALLTQKRLAYTGLTSRTLSDLIDNERIKLSYDKVYIIGFNAVNKAQEKLFSYLHKNEIARFYWDFDDFYIKPEAVEGIKLAKKEAGFYMRKNLEKFKPELYKNGIRRIEEKKQIDVIGVPLFLGQAKSLNKILSEKPFSNLNKTAVVLGDENMLFPVLHSLPESIEKINITMGLPVKETSLFGFISIYLNLHRNFIKTGQSKGYYHKDVLAILRHPLLQSHNEEITKKLIDEIITHNKNHIAGKDLVFGDENALSIVFENPANWEELLVNMLNLLYFFFTIGTKTDEKSPEDEYIYQVYIHLKRLLELLNKNKVDKTVGFDIIIKLVHQFMLSIRVPFEGEPDEGLQIMGLMETRNIDFENVIILDVNEGVIPKTSKPQSFIPENLRAVFGLPVTKHQDAIFGYLFFRLLQRAKNICFIYNNLSGDNNSGELSRFVQQLIYETPHKINIKYFQQSISLKSPKPITVFKDDEIKKLLSGFYIADKKRRRKLSASAINTYLDCRLRFYFKYVANIAEHVKVEEEIDPAVFGTILHAAIEFVYNTHCENRKTKTIVQKDFPELYKLIDKSVDEAFADFYKNDRNAIFTYEGTQIIAREAVKKYTRIILDVDKRTAPFEIVELESKYRDGCDFPITVDGRDYNVSLYGIIDRLDKKDGEIRIIDYKSGKADQVFASMNDLFDPELENRKKAVFQIFFYAYLYLSTHGRNAHIKPGIYSIRQMNDENYTSEIVFKEGKIKTVLNHTNFLTFYDEFIDCFRELLEEMFDNRTPYTQTTKEQSCPNCPYAVICGRE